MYTVRHDFEKKNLILGTCRVFFCAVCCTAESTYFLCLAAFHKESQSAHGVKSSDSFKPETTKGHMSHPEMDLPGKSHGRCIPGQSHSNAGLLFEKAKGTHRL